MDTYINLKYICLFLSCFILGYDLGDIVKSYNKILFLRNIVNNNTYKIINGTLSAVSDNRSFSMIKYYKILFNNKYSTYTTHNPDFGYSHSSTYPILKRDEQLLYTDFHFKDCKLISENQDFNIIYISKYKVIPENDCHICVDWDLIFKEHDDKDPTLYKTNHYLYNGKKCFMVFRCDDINKLIYLKAFVTYNNTVTEHLEKKIKNTVRDCILINTIIGGMYYIFNNAYIYQKK